MLLDQLLGAMMALVPSDASSSTMSCSG